MIVGYNQTVETRGGDIPQIVSRDDARTRGLAHYFTGSECKNGHTVLRRTTSGHCLGCTAAAMKRHGKTKKRKDYLASYLAIPLNRDKYREAVSRWQNNPLLKEDIAKKRRAHLLRLYHENDEWRERKLAMQREHRKKPQHRQKIRQTMATWARNKRKEDVNYRLRCRLRSRLREALSGKTKNGSAVRLLGCSIEGLRNHIERQFKPEMTWSNWGRGADGAMEWHLDHVRPLASFDLTDPNQLALACHYTNLQPLWAVENIRKGARLQ